MRQRVDDTRETAAPVQEEPQIGAKRDWLHRQKPNQHDAKRGGGGAINRWLLTDGLGQQEEYRALVASGH